MGFPEVDGAVERVGGSEGEVDGGAGAGGGVGGEHDLENGASVGRGLLRLGARSECVEEVLELLGIAGEGHEVGVLDLPCKLQKLRGRYINFWESRKK